jgi:2'-5' RNA ligase
MKLNIALALPDKVRARDIALSRELARQYEAYFVLGENENYPHITVYAVEFPDDAQEFVLETTRQVAEQFQPILCVVTRVETHQGYVGVELEKSPALVQLHEEIVKALAPLRIQKDASGAEYAMSFTPEQQENLKEYGYADAMQLYNPHFTITRLKSDQEAAKAVQTITWDISEFIAASLAVFTSGEHGTCKELIQEFPLGA